MYTDAACSGGLDSAPPLAIGLGQPHFSFDQTIAFHASPRRCNGELAAPKEDASSATPCFRNIAKAHGHGMATVGIAAGSSHDPDV